MLTSDKFLSISIFYLFLQGSTVICPFAFKAQIVYSSDFYKNKIFHGFLKENIVKDKKYLIVSWPLPEVVRICFAFGSSFYLFSFVVRPF